MLPGHPPHSAEACLQNPFPPFYHGWDLVSPTRPLHMDHLFSVSVFIQSFSLSLFPLWFFSLSAAVRCSGCQLPAPIETSLLKPCPHCSVPTQTAPSSTVPHVSLHTATHTTHLFTTVSLLMNSPSFFPPLLSSPTSLFFLLFSLFSPTLVFLSHVAAAGMRAVFGV